jgi:hypothetical protein
MSRLHAEEEQAREEAAMFRDELIGPLQAALGPDVRVLSSKLGGSWRLPENSCVISKLK